MCPPRSIWHPALTSSQLPSIHPSIHPSMQASSGIFTRLSRGNPHIHVNAAIPASRWPTLIPRSKTASYRRLFLLQDAVPAWRLRPAERRCNTAVQLTPRRVSIHLDLQSESFKQKESLVVFTRCSIRHGDTSCRYVAVGRGVKQIRRETGSDVLHTASTLRA